MTRILHLIHGLTMGGAEVDLLRKSRILTKSYGCKITIGCLLRRGELMPQAKTVGINIIGPLMHCRYDFTAILKMRRLIQTGAWDIVHSHLFAANLITSFTMATLAHHPPLIVAEHAMADRWGQGVLLADRTLIQKQTELILVPSQAAADSYIDRGLVSDSFRVMPNAIETQQFNSVDQISARQHIRQTLNIPQDKILIGTISRLQRIKGLPILLEAILPLPVHLIIIGDGPEYPHLASLVQTMNLTHRVQLLGTRTEILQFLAAIDIFVLPSYSETFGMVVAEALLSDTPVIATRVGGIPEITHGDNYANLIPPGNVQALTQSIRQVIRHLPEAKQRAQRGHTFVQNTFSTEVVSEAQYMLYQKIISRHTQE